MVEFRGDGEVSLKWSLTPIFKEHLMQARLLVAAALVSAAVVHAEPLPDENAFCDELPQKRMQYANEPDALEWLEARAGACRVRVSMTQAEAEQLLKGAAFELSVIGDRVTFVARASADKVYASGAQYLKMDRIGDSDLWVAGQHRVNTAEGTITYYPDAVPALHDPITRVIVWQGPDAPKIPPLKENLSGQLLDLTLFSQALQETRRVVVYLPPGCRRNGAYPALYLTDGQTTKLYARRIEYMIDHGLIQPIVLIGEVSGQAGIVEDRSSLNVDLRSADYLDGFAGAGDRFDRHMRFFAGELVSWTEEKFALAKDRRKRAVHGYSSGAAFATEAAFQHAEVFGTALAFSAGWIPLSKTSPPTAKRAHFILAAGYYEVPYLHTTRRTDRNLRSHGFEVSSEYVYAGHDIGVWSMLLCKYLPSVFERQ